ncbi:MAG: ADP-forming succinate--CoA ligase subunit beta [Chloroflexi bacterium]|nr:ADP-forming succinate--CoA ligase subunit beta [Chloroflexota bacterium]MQC47623.1 ADP-forming succinate--CoA ligase subunit beta [Chloroflexota bacterium]
MKLHEYQAKEVLARFGVPVPQGRVATTPDEAEAIAKELGGKVVIKAQAHTGARGKAGGVKLANNPAEAKQFASEIIGMTLVTHQTGPQGLPVNSVLVEEAIDIDKEIYLSVAIDNSSGRPVIIASPEGGMDIEEVAATNPGAIHSTRIDPACGFQLYQGRQLALAVGLGGEHLNGTAGLIGNLAKAFLETDASMVEINPLVLTKDGRVLAADAKFSIDDSADYRQKDLIALQDRSQEPEIELEAHDAGVQNYVKLDGNIGCLVNGAGLAMATLDAIKYAGGDAANFLDIGTANNPEAIVTALKIIGNDPDVKVVLVNIFGGLARTDVIAEGTIQAINEGYVKQPVVVRLAGTNFELGLKILDESGLDLGRADGFAEAARMAVAAAK